MNSSHSKRLLVASGPQPLRPELRLIGFPHAGAGKVPIRVWGNAVPRGCSFLAARLPGREDRGRDHPFQCAEEAAAALANEIASLAPVPFALMGHSMGALLSFLTARRLEWAGCVGLRHLFVAGFRAPHLPGVPIKASTMSDAELLNELDRLDGTPSDVLGDPELMALLLPVLRADMDMIQRFKFHGGPKLHSPITAFAGAADTYAGPNLMKGWSNHTTGAFRLEIFPGGHFFFKDSCTSMNAVIKSTLIKLIRN